MPALALMRSGEAPAANPDAAQNQSPNQSQSETLNLVILAQCDGQRVLYQNFNNATAAPTIEQLDVFASHWSGSLILISSRASQAGALAKFDFSWFVPAMVKYRKLLGEVLLISFMLQLFGLVSPLFFQVVMDKVLVSLHLYFGLSLAVVPLLRQRLDVKFVRGADNQATLAGNHHRHPSRQGHGAGARLL